jgi:putative SbcD/Mre11-related phosphoesterase
MKFLEEGAIFLKEINAIVIGDLHLGYEIELRKKGINVSLNLYEKIEKIKKKTSAKNIILLGDVKHNIFRPNEKEERIIKEFFEILNLNFSQIFVVKGNHDAFLEEYISAKIFSSRGFKIGKYGFFHGNSKPLKKVLSCKYLFCSHLHSKLFLPEDIKKYEVPIFIVAKGKNKIIILPPFNDILFGKEFEVESKFLRDLLKNHKIEFISLKGEVIDVKFL